jgi:hypothetical protein
MHSIRWAAALCLTVGTTLLGGCQNKPAPAPEPVAATPAPDRIAAAKATLVAQGVAVGEVDAASDSYARVTGLDSKVVTPADDISFIDVATGRVVNIGRLHGTTDQGALLIKAGSFGERAPRIGDLAAKLK